MTKRDSKLPVSPNGKRTYVKGVKFKHLLLKGVTENYILQWPMITYYKNMQFLFKNCFMKSTWLFGLIEATDNKHNLGKNLSNQFGSILTLTQLAK